LRQRKNIEQAGGNFERYNKAESPDVLISMQKTVSQNCPTVTSRKRNELGHELTANRMSD